MIEYLKKIRRRILTKLRLRPIHKVMSFLKQKNYLLTDNVLEVFGYTGDYHTKEYVRYVKHLEIWEIEPSHEEKLKKNLPDAKVKITDSFKEIKTVPEKYDMIIVDNHQGVFGDNYCEHFEIIDDCYKKLKNRSVLIVNVIPKNSDQKNKIPSEKFSLQTARRKAYYNHATGVDIPVEQLEQFYHNLSLKNGFKINHIYFLKRNYLLYYMTLCLERTDS